MALTPASNDPRREQRLRDKQENPVNWGDFSSAPDLQHRRQKEQKEQQERKGPQGK